MKGSANAPQFFALCGRAVVRLSTVGQLAAKQATLALCLLLAASPAFGQEQQLANAPSPALPSALAEAKPSLALCGAPLSLITLSAPQEEDAAALLALTDLRPGYLLDAQAVRSAIERLYALGRFGQVEAFVHEVAGSIELTIALSPVLRLDSIECEGLKVLKEAPLLRSLRLLPGDEIDSRSKAAVLERAAKHAAEMGLPLATFHLEQRPGRAPNTVAYALTATEGPINVIASVQVAGSLPVARGVLGYGLYARPRAAADRERLEQDRLLLRKRLRDHGFLRAQVRLLPLGQAPDGAVVTFVVDAFERLIFRFDGNALFADSELRAAWPEHIDGAPRSLVPLYVQRLKNLYTKLGYRDARVRVRLGHPGPRGPKRSLVVAVQVVEGRPAEVSELALVGNTSFPADLWQAQVRGRLAGEATGDSFFEPLGPAYAAAEDAVRSGLLPSPRRLAPEQRFVQDIYKEAAADVGVALGEVGFLQADISEPTTVALAQHALAVYPPESFVSGDEARPLAFARAPARPAASASEMVRAEVQVQDGPQTFVERLTIVGSSPLSASEVRAYMVGARQGTSLAAPLGAGNPYSPLGLEDARIALTKVLRNQGYLYAAIDVTVSPDPSQSTAVEVVLTVRPGPKVHINHLLVRGNRHTRQGVIRSRLRLRASDVYRLEQAVDDQQQIMALGTFSRVSVRLVDEEHQSDSKDVVVEVEERPRQLVEVVPGLSSTQGPRLLASYTHLNVFGTASTFVAALKLNRQIFFGIYGQYSTSQRERFRQWHGVSQLTRAVEREVRLGLRAPPLRALYFDPLFRIDLVDQRINAVRYGLDVTTLTLGADLKLLRRLIGAVEVQGGVASLECPLGDNCGNTQNELRRLRGGRIIQEGRYNTIKVGPWLRYEGRNDSVSPTRGVLLYGRVTQVFGRALRKPDDFTFRFIKYEGQVSTYLPLGRPVLALNLRFGTMQIQQSQVPIDERFLLGGRDTMRGFVEGTLIADDACVVYPGEDPPANCVGPIPATPTGGPPVSLGGNSFMVLKNELRVPIRGGLSLDLFADVGNLWLDLWHIEHFRLRVTTGVGLRYATPVGAMTIDFGINPKRRPRNEEALWQVHFSIGSF